MAESLPSELSRLLAASDDVSRARAWTAFLDTYSRLILHAARSATTGYDDGMDAYAAALDGIRADDYRKLRGYSVDPRSKFTTWLVVVVRRICVDNQRARYGRGTSDERNAGIVSDERAARRRLANLTSTEIDLDSIQDSIAGAADQVVERAELREALESSLSELAERDQLLLTLRFVDDLPAKRIAEVQGWPDHMAVYRRVNHLLAELRKKLRARGIDTSVP
jgi:RNA polymerase sigma factor (sigma-70 family)